MDMLINQGYNRDVKRYSHGISYTGLNCDNIDLGVVGFNLNEINGIIENHQNLVYKFLMLEFIENFLEFMKTKFGGNPQASIAKALILCDMPYKIIGVSAGVFLVYLWQLRNAIAHNDYELGTYDECVNKLNGNGDAIQIKKYLQGVDKKESWNKIDWYYTGANREILLIEKNLPSGGKMFTVNHAFNVIFSCAKIIHEEGLK